MRDITDLMNGYRECARNLWNVYFSRYKDVGAALDSFEQIRELLFDSLVLGVLEHPKGTENPPALLVIPRSRSLILINRSSGSAEAGHNQYWDQVKDVVVGPEDITLQFLDYFDFGQVPIMDFRYLRCRVLRFPSHPEYEGREALVEALGVSIMCREATSE